MHSLTEQFLKNHNLDPVVACKELHCDRPAIDNGGFDLDYQLDRLRGSISRLSILLTEYDGLIAQQYAAKWAIDDQEHLLSIANAELNFLKSTERTGLLDKVRNLGSYALNALNDAKYYLVTTRTDRVSLTHESTASGGHDGAVGGGFADYIRSRFGLGQGTIIRRDLSGIAQAELMGMSIDDKVKQYESTKYNLEKADVSFAVYRAEEANRIARLESVIRHNSQQIQEKKNFLENHQHGINQKLNRVKLQYFELLQTTRSDFRRLSALYEFKFKENLVESCLSMFAGGNSPDLIACMQLGLDKASRSQLDALHSMLEIRLSKSIKYNSQVDVTIDLVGLFEDMEITAPPNHVELRGLYFYTENILPIQVDFKYLYDGEYINGVVQTNHPKNTSIRSDLQSSGRMLSGIPLGEVQFKLGSSPIDEVLLEAVVHYRPE